MGAEKFLNTTHPIAPEAYRTLVKRRALSLIDDFVPAENWNESEVARKEAEVEIMTHFEKIHLGNDLLPVSYLYKSAERAKAVCRIVLPNGYGTAFLIGDGLLLTNNHVLTSSEVAEMAYAEFDYEEDKQIVKVLLKPEVLFITEAGLDYTIVACDTVGIEDIMWHPMQRNTASVARGEQVNIIQHPGGRKKMVALHENKVTYVYDKVIRYTTDTEPGASGSPVYNNNWDLVALHHAGQEHDNGTATNEGIRIAAIVNDLILKSQSRGRYQQQAAAILNMGVEGTSPELGFFDVAGLLDIESIMAPEVEIPTYTGNKQFADVGFWNIENFNNNTSARRVEKVGDIIATLSMDVLGLIEVEKGALDGLVTNLHSRGAYMDYLYFDAPGKQDLALLYDKETTVATLREDIYEKYRVLLNSKTASGKTAFASGRLPLFAECTIKEEAGIEVRFLMIVVHLKAFGDIESRERRRLAARVISVILNDLRENEQLPVLLGGDFNNQLDDDILSDLNDAADLFTLTTDDHANGALSYVGQNHRSLIDHIYVSNDVVLGDISNDDAAIVRLDKSIAQFVRDISDHVPLVTRLIYHQTTPIDVPLRDPGNPDTPIADTPIPMDSRTDNRVTDAVLIAHHNIDRYKQSDKAYYDFDKDKDDVEQYYAALSGTQNELEKFNTLSRLLRESHTKKLNYQEARLRHLYPVVDLHPDGVLKSIYSDKTMQVETIIADDFNKEIAINNEIARLLNNESFLTDEMIGEALEQLEREMQFNCEHVVPQSWFNKREPMKSDLHHLFTCEPSCNSSRGNSPYYDFEDYTPLPDSYSEAIREQCGKSASSKFEPYAGKGAVARATLYFLARYPDAVNRYKGADIDVLIQWHRQFAVSLFEKHRNACIFKVQGNRNPFVDHDITTSFLDPVEVLLAYRNR